jgi:hypothetical protein
MKLEFSRQIFEKPSNIQVHENLSSVSRVVPCTQTNRRTKQIVPFRSFANAPKMVLFKARNCFSLASPQTGEKLLDSPDSQLNTFSGAFHVWR